MRFISVSDDYQCVIHPGAQQLVPGAGGVYYPQQILPHLVAEFERKVVPYAEREAARMHFDDQGRESNGDEPGAYRRAGVFSDEELAGMGYDGQPREHYYGVFDTDDVPVEQRGMFEAVLTGDLAACGSESKRHNLSQPLNASSDVGARYIRVDQVSAALAARPPWPGYEEFSGAGAFKDLIEFAKSGRIPLEALLEYEQARPEGPRSTYVSAFEKAIDERGPLGSGQGFVVAIPGNG